MTSTARVGREADVSLIASDLVFGYARGRDVLRGASIQVEPGERLALIGPSGCGKSTLAALLAGHLRPRSGSVRVDAAPIPTRGYSPVQLIAQHPERAINPRRRMRQALDEAWAVPDELLASLGIRESWLGRYPAELSAGELQRFAIARALGPRTRYLVADEMTVMLDTVSQAQIWRLLLRIVDERDMGLVLVTHDRALAEEVCHRTVEFAAIDPGWRYSAPMRSRG
jgi:peptide/nickel transport system ATP-binding protein